MPKNLLLISLDTLRADVAYSGKFPTIESLRDRGTSFLHTVSSSPLTPISHASVFTGLQPPSHGVRHLLREQLGPEFTTLAQVLGEAGYATGAVVSCPGLNRWYGMDAGFEHYDDWIPPLADGRDALSVVDVKLRGTALKRAPLVIERGLEWLGRAEDDRPKCLFLHFFDSHWPYEPPEDVGVEVANPYEGEVAYMDHYLGRFLEAAAELGLSPDNTLTVLFSDHGEDLAGWYPDDHGGDCGHPEENGHGALLFDVTQLVPLIICDPDRPTPVDIGHQVRLIDIMPTVLDLLGLPARAVEGQSLLGLLQGEDTRDRAAYCEAFYREELAAIDPEWAHLTPLQAVRFGDSKIIWEYGGDAVYHYDLAVDPTERHPQTLSRSWIGAGPLDGQPPAQ